MFCDVFHSIFQGIKIYYLFDYCSHSQWHFHKAKKGVTIWVSVTIWVLGGFRGEDIDPSGVPAVKGSALGGFGSWETVKFSSGQKGCHYFG